MRVASGERRQHNERMHRRRDVVNEPWVGELRRPDASAKRGLGFVHANRTAGARERDCRREAVRAGADDDRVQRSAVIHRVTSSVEWLCLYPIEAAAHEKEFRKVVERHRHLNVLPIHVALEGQPRW